MLVGLPPLCRICYETPKVNNPTTCAERWMLRWADKNGITLEHLNKVYGKGVADWIRLTVEGATKKRIKNSRVSATRQNLSEAR